MIFIPQRGEGRIPNFAVRSHRIMMFAVGVNTGNEVCPLRGDEVTLLHIKCQRRHVESGLTVYWVRGQEYRPYPDAEGAFQRG